MVLIASFICMFFRLDSMPIQPPGWTDILSCSLCLKTYDQDRVPYTLPCGHTVCESCLKDLSNMKCNFDSVEYVKDNIVPNLALMSLLNTADESDIKKASNCEKLIIDLSTYLEPIAIGKI